MSLSPQHGVKYFQRVITCVVVCLLLVLIPACSSGEPRNYARVSVESCGQALVSTSMVDHIVCCQFSELGICVAAYDHINFFLTSAFAVLLPFVPLCLSALLVVPFRTGYKGLLTRAKFCVFVILYRTVSCINRVLHVLLVCSHSVPTLTIICNILCSGFCTKPLMWWKFLFLGWVLMLVMAVARTGVGIVNLGNVLPTFTHLTAVII